VRWTKVGLLGIDEVLQNDPKAEAVPGEFLLSAEAHLFNLPPSTIHADYF